MRRVKLGLIGAGIIVREQHAPALQALAAQFEIVAICSRTEASARSLGAEVGCSAIYTDVHQLLARPDVEAVDIAVPIHLNLEMCRAAARAGKQIICEKPLAANLEDARAVLRLPAEYDVICMTAENFRYARDFAQVREWVHSGAIGEPLLAQWKMITPFDPAGNKYVGTAWRQEPAHIGGFISDAGVHYVDVLRTTLGEVEQVQSFMTRNQPILGSYDTAVVNLRMAGGMPVNLTMSWAAAGGAGSEGLEIFGSDGTIVSNRAGTALYRAGHVASRYHGPPSAGFAEELADFYLAITQGKAPEMTLEEGYRDLAVTLAAVESAETGQVVRVEEFLARRGAL